MPRKTGRKSPNRRERMQDRLFSIERGLFRTLSRALFAFGMLLMIYIGLASELLLVVALASVGIFVWMAIIVPTDQFQDVGRYLLNGDAGADLHDWIVGLIPGRRKR